MELKTVFVQDVEGRIVPSPTAYVYQAGTTTLVAGLKDVSGADLSNPFTGTIGGQVQVRAPDGEYDLRILGGGRDTTMRVRFIDVPAYLGGITVACATVAALRALPTATGGADFGGSSWQIAAAAGYTAQIAADTAMAYFAPSTIDATKVWVRADDRPRLLLRRFILPADGANIGPALRRAAALARIVSRDIDADSAAAYNLYDRVKLAPRLLDGWTPTIYGNGSTLTLGHATPQASDEAAGMTWEGVKSGHSTNTKSGGFKGWYIDVQNINFANGLRVLWGENASGVEIANVHVRNMRLGYFIGNWCYMEGGDANGFTVRMCSAEGYVTPFAGSNSWFGISLSGDQSIAQPAQAVPAGTSVIVATPSTAGIGSTDTRPVALNHIWTNGTGGTINLPATFAGFTEAALTALGLTKGASFSNRNGSVDSYSVVVLDYYESKGARLARGIGRNTDPVIDGFRQKGGYYGAYLQNTLRAQVKGVEVVEPIRGVALEFTNDEFDIQMFVRDSASSAFVAAYGSDLGNLDLKARQMTTRWDGEAILNLRTSITNGRFKVDIVTRDNVANGQYLAYLGVNSPNNRIFGTLNGDCTKAMVAIESDWNSALAESEHWGYTKVEWDSPGSVAMTGIDISGLEVKLNTSKVAGVGVTFPTGLAIVQGREVGVSGIKIARTAFEDPRYRAAFKIIQQATITANKVRKVHALNLKFDSALTPTTAPAAIVLPDKLAHFDPPPVNVTLLADGIERPLPTGAKPDTTFSTLWFCQDTSEVTGLLDNGPWTGREIRIRGIGAGSPADTANTGTKTFNKVGFDGPSQRLGFFPRANASTYAPIAKEIMVLQYATTLGAYTELR